jgi:hypothetical protein
MSEKSEAEGRLDPKMAGPLDAIGGQRVGSAKGIGKTNLRMGAPYFISGGKSFVNLHNGPIHCNLLDDLAGEIDVILR